LFSQKSTNNHHAFCFFLSKAALAQASAKKVSSVQQVKHKRDKPTKKTAKTKKTNDKRRSFAKNENKRRRKQEKNRFWKKIHGALFEKKLTRTESIRKKTTTKRKRHEK